MVEILKTILLGLVQGLTEFLPVSSSGHLVLLSGILGTGEVLFVSVMLHFGTLLAVCYAMRSDILRIFKEKNFHMVGKLIVASIPAAVVMLLLREKIQTLFESGKGLCFGFFATAVLLLVTDRFSKNSPNKPLTYKTALVMGLCQAIAPLPGISRSGSTIGGGVISGASRSEVAVFSFYMSVVIIFGSTIFEVGSVTLTDVNIAATLLGMLAACLSGVFAIKLLMKLISGGKLKFFSYYLFALSAVTFFHFFISPIW